MQFRNFMSKFTKYAIEYWYICLLSLFVIFCIYFVGGSIDKHRQEEIKMKNFVKFETERFKQISNYRMYGAMGVNLSFSPSDSSILFKNSVAFSEIISTIDSAYSLRIGENYQGESLFRRKVLLSMDFSKMILFLGTIFSIFLGYLTFRRREYLKTVVSKHSGLIVYIKKNLSRTLLIACLICLLYFVAYLTLVIRGIQLSTGELLTILGHLLSSFIMLMCCYAIGLLIGTLIKNKLTAVLFCISVVGFLLVLVPVFIEDNVSTGSSSIDFHKNELKKLSILMKFEKMVSTIIRNEKNQDTFTIKKNFMDQYLKNEYREIESLDIALRNDLAKSVNRYNDLAILSPVSFQLLTSLEAGSKGYRNFLDYYDYLIAMRRRFVSFWNNQVYYRNSETMVNFIKGDENVFRGKSRLPKNYFKGIIINTAYILIFFGLSYIAFKRSLFHMKKSTIKALEPVNMKLFKDRLNVFIVGTEQAKDFMFNILAGKTLELKKVGFSGSISIEDKEIIFDSPLSKHDFLYLCKLDDLPQEIKVKKFLKSFTTYQNVPKEIRHAVFNTPEIKSIWDSYIGELKGPAKLEVLLAMTHLAKKQVYLFYDTVTGLPYGCAFKLYKRFEELQKEGSMVVYLTSIGDIPLKEDHEINGFEDGSGWIYNAMALQQKIKMKDRLGYDNDLIPKN